MSDICLMMIAIFLIAIAYDVKDIKHDIEQHKIVVEYNK